MLGVTLHAAGRSDEALPWFERASKNRGGAMLWNNHAAALLASGRAREAAELARRVVAVDPNNAGGRLNVGLACEIEGDLPGAVSAISQSLSSQPGNTAARRALARVQLALKDPAGSQATFLAIPEGTDNTADSVARRGHDRAAGTGSGNGIARSLGA